MQATSQRTFDDVNLELSGLADSQAPSLPAEATVHPFEAAKLGKAPFECVGCEIGDCRCAYCTTKLKYLYHIKDANGRTFIVGSECVKQTGGAVAGFETFNRQMAARVREMQRQARQQRQAAKAQEEAQAWKDAHAAEWAYMERRAASGNGFYQYLTQCVAKYGSLYDYRLEAVRGDMRKDEQRQAAPVRPAAPVVNLEAVETAFAKARAAGIRFPKLRLGGFVFSPAGERSANPGAVYVKQRQPAGELPGAYLGKVLGGKFLRARDCDDKAEAEIVEISKDPRAAAVAYGKKFGRCSVCNRELTDAASVEAGIGPVCAEKYGF